MITSSSGTIVGGTINSAKRDCRKRMLLLFAAGSARPSVTGGCHGKCGDVRPYADVLRIASAKALRGRRGKSAQEPTKAIPIRSEPQETDSYCG